MRRHVFNLLLVPSLLLFVASVTLWLRSRWTSEWFTYAWKQPVSSPRKPWTAKRWSIISTRGTIAFERTTWDVDTRGLFLVGLGPGSAGFSHVPIDASIRVLPPVGKDQQGVLTPLGFRADVEVSDSFTTREVQWIVAVPDWSVAAISAILPVAGYIRRRRWWVRKCRGAAGQCIECGYDFRATPGRCPECGSAAAAAVASSP